MEGYLPDLYQPTEESLEYYKSEFREEYIEETVYDVWENCVMESVNSIYSSVYGTVFLNIIFGLVTSFGIPQILFHSLSAVCGIYLLLNTIQSKEGLVIIFTSFICAYGILFIRHLLLQKWQIKLKQRGLRNIRQFNSFGSASIIQYTLIAIFVLFEYILLEKETWLNIRGIMMIFSMKLISLAVDTDSQKLPNFFEYCGYVFCCGNVLFGPWISFEHYMIQTKYPTRKNGLWLLAVTKALLLSVFFLSVSNCWISYFIDDNSNRWLIGYREALSFRTSHYFISCLSEAFILAAGWKELEHHFDDGHWKFPISNFLKIEFPSALAIVIVNWNKPMHEFLKTYIYRKWLPIGKFYAVLLTFVMSSLFHGFELKVSTVLVSLGVFSYLQILVREHFSQAFDICVKVHPCRTCKHKIKRDHIIWVLMDQTTDLVGIYQKWNNLYFVSLWIMFINYLIVK